MEKITLHAQKRNIVGKKVANLRKEGFIPAVLYGQGKVGDNLSIKLKEFKKVYEAAGESTLVDLDIDGKTQKVLLTEPQYDPVTDVPLHVDIFKIRMDKEITANVELEFIGESPAVKELEGSLIKNKDSVEIECLPANLIPKIDVDISVLKTFDDAILVKDLNVPAEVKILDEAEETVALVNPPRSEEELAAMEEEAAADTEKAGIEKMEADAEAEKAQKEAEKTEGEEAKPEEKKEEAK